MALLQWHFVTKAEYIAGEKQDDHLYFLSDTGEIYRGIKSFTESVSLYPHGSLPETPALNRIYFDDQTLEGKINNGTQWLTVIKPVDDTVTAGSANPVSASAVATYVAQQIEAGLTSAAVIKELVYDKNNKSITVTKGNNTTSTLVMEGLAVNVTCKSENNKSIIQLLDVNNNPVGDTVELDVERFITSAEYNNETKSIILYFDGKTGDESTDKIVIPVGDLVDTYTVESTSSVDLSMVENKIKAAVKISAAANNVAIIKDDGVFVPAVDTSGFMLKVSGAVAGNVPIFDENGQIVDSGKTFAEVTGDVTELKDAVDAVKEDIQALNEAKLDKSSVLDSASMSSSSATASDESTLSEKAILTMIEWKTTM